MTRYLDTPLEPFPLTEWSLVDRAGGDRSSVRQRALKQLLEQYMPALLAHLVRNKRIDPVNAEDVVQGFVCSKILEKGLITKADRDRGRFRTLLLTALDRFVIDEFRRGRRWDQMARGEDTQIEYKPDTAASPTRVFEIAWAKSILDRALAQMKTQCDHAGRQDLWELFECRILRPTLDNEPPVAYEQLIEKYGYESPQQAFNRLYSAKRLFAQILRQIVAEYAGDRNLVEVEIQDIIKILGQHGP